jgi:EGF-like domain/Human growth factor-like EGF
MMISATFLAVLLVFLFSSMTLSADVESVCVEDSDCLNGGECRILKSSNTTQCRCASGYRGANCDTYCPLKCNNGGTCHPEEGKDDSFVCHCRSGFMGHQCDMVVTACESGLKCFNGGTCVVTNGETTCQCPYTHEGTHCEVSLVMETCLDGHYCLNEGSCVAHESDAKKYRCECPSSYEGSNCEVKQEMSPLAADQTGGIIVGVLVIGMALLIGGMFIQKSRGTSVRAIDTAEVAAAIDGDAGSVKLGSVKEEGPRDGSNQGEIELDQEGQPNKIL